MAYGVSGGLCPTHGQYVIASKNHRIGPTKEGIMLTVTGSQLHAALAMAGAPAASWLSAPTHTRTRPAYMAIVTARPTSSPSGATGTTKPQRCDGQSRRLRARRNRRGATGPPEREADRSLSPRLCRNGSRLSVPRPPTSSGAATGRTATSRASTPGFAMSCSTARIFYTFREAQIVIESWRRHYNTIRPHASIGYKPPAPEVFVPAFAAWPAALRRPAEPATLAQRPTLN